MSTRASGDRTSLADMGVAKRGTDPLQPENPDQIKKITDAVLKGVERLKMRVDIKDTDGKFIDTFVTSVAPGVGDFIDLEVHGEATSYEIIERRLSLKHFTDKISNQPAKVREFLIIARPVSG